MAAALPTGLTPPPPGTGAHAPKNQITIHGRTFEVVLYTINPQGAKLLQQMGSLSTANLQHIQTLASQALANIGQSPHWANVTGIDHQGVTVSTPGQHPQTFSHIDPQTNNNLWIPVEQAVNSAVQGTPPTTTTAAHPTTTPGGVAPLQQHPLPVPPNPAIQATHMSVFQHQPLAITNNLNQLTYAHVMNLPLRARLRALKSIDNGSLQINSQPATLAQDIAACERDISALGNPNLDDTTRQAIDALYYAPRLSGTLPAFQSLLPSNFTGMEHIIGYYREMARVQNIHPRSFQIPTNDPGQFINFWKRPIPTNADPGEYADAALCLVEALAYFADEDPAPINASAQSSPSNWSRIGSIANGVVYTAQTAASAVTTVYNGVKWIWNGVNWALSQNQQPTSTPSTVTATPNQQQQLATAQPRPNPQPRNQPLGQQGSLSGVSVSDTDDDDE